ncbi:MAG TPA: flagellar hook-basal body protein [Gaiellaceae bacterium]|nr:flagellar hook-basal body protein [Gaiellaceae bacterium]
MDRGLYIAASGMLAELTRQDQIANDLANSSTPGYKSDRSVQQSFGDLLLANSSTGQPIGSLGLGTAIVAERTDLSQAPLRETGQPLDLALEGEGFFAVQTTAGTRYTRDGQFQLDGAGRLVNQSDLPVLDSNGKPITIGNAAKDVTIGPDGTITAGGRAIARLNVVSLTAPVKEGDTLFSGIPGAVPATTAVRQGSVEGSGVNPARAMVDMLVSFRAYEAQQRVVHAIDETLQKGISAGGPGSG